ncbi:copper homeostasis protein CutC [Oceanobacillus timonensis]|uniref:copper homeostasis protein CutC n=1 Tax=Oceanobacillus timonensis TaxID=1926285 RepID=UPI0009BB74B2|nr:copper homeostasis protein CutC [Oceanobacillus timonensis]
MIECIVQNAIDAKDAENLGVSRLELVSAIQLGGLTPAYETIQQVLDSVRLPVQIMIRPHDAGFIYTLEDKEIMKKDIYLLCERGHHRIVVGALTEKKTIDTVFLDDLFGEFPKLDVTFHRAFDEVRDLTEAYQTLVAYQKNIKRILTSGGTNGCVEGADSLHRLVQLQHTWQGPSILPGSGLNVNNIQDLHGAIQANEYHFGSGVRKGQSFEERVDKDIIKRIQHILLR